jgi:hypothetical protein
MKITKEFNKYVNALLKEFNNSDIEMWLGVDSEVLRFVPNKYDFKIIREIFKEISLFPMINNQRISFKDIKPGDLLVCIRRFKSWANLNGFEWSNDLEEWKRICKLYE